MNPSARVAVITLLLAGVVTAVWTAGRSVSASVPDPVVRQLVLDVLNVAPTELDVTAVAERTGAWTATGKVGGRAIQAQGSSLRGMSSIAVDIGRWEFEDGIGIEEAKIRCREVLNARFGDDAERMVLTSASKLQGGLILLGWRVEVAEGVSTGATASFTLEPESGAIASYSERKPPRSVAQSDVQIDRARAMELAQPIANMRVPKGGPPVLLSAQLVLSSLLHPDQGPAWLLTYRYGGSGTQQTGSGFVVALDGMTGAELTRDSASR